VQEWVNNILKYSDATQVTIQITKDQREITLTIEDNGMGFELSKLTEGKGNGWKNIRSRANLIKGDLEIDSTPGKRGNMLILNIPVDIPQIVVAEEIATH
jgi:signal transduction histidine kinase